MKSNYIAVSPDEIVDEDSNYTDVIDWFNRNTNHENVILISEEQIYKLRKVWDIVNEHNNSMIGLYEDDVIYDGGVKEKVLKALEQYRDRLANGEEATLIEAIIRLLKTSISRNKPLYFYL